MAFRYIQFLNPVQFGGKHGNNTYWSHDKHAGALEVEEKGAWLHLYPCEKLGDETKRTGRRIRVPMTNVGYIDEVDDKAVKA